MQQSANVKDIVVERQHARIREMTRKRPLAADGAGSDGPLANCLRWMLYLLSSDIVWGYHVARTYLICNIPSLLQHIYYRIKQFLISERLHRNIQ